MLLPVVVRVPFIGGGVFFSLLHQRLDDVSGAHSPLFFLLLQVLSKGSGTKLFRSEGLLFLFGLDRPCHVKRDAQ